MVSTTGLLLRLGDIPMKLIIDFVGNRCTLCDENMGVLLRDGGRQWQIWCFDCALSLLADDVALDSSTATMLRLYRRSEIEQSADTDFYVLSQMSAGR